MRSRPVLELEQRDHAVVVGVLELSLCCDGGIGCGGGVVAVGVELREGVVDVPHGHAEQVRHLRDPGIRWTVHGLGLVHEVARVGEDPVDAAREREHVLGLERSHEGGAQHAQQLSLRRFALAAWRREPPGAAPTSPAAHVANASTASIVTATWRRSSPSTSGVSGRNQLPAPHATSRQITSATAASAAVTGIVIIQARPIWRTTAQCTWCQRLRPAPIPTTEEATTCVVDAGAPDDRGPEDDAGGSGLAGETRRSA